MNFKRKRNIKKLAKIYATIQWLFVIIFAVTVIVIIIQGSSVLFWVMAIPSMLLSFTFNILSIFCSNKRTNYLSNIEKYKQSMYFNTILDLLKEKNFDDAIHIYNYCLKKGKLKDILYDISSVRSKVQYTKTENRMAMKILTNLETNLKPNTLNFN